MGVKKEKATHTSDEVAQCGDKKEKTTRTSDEVAQCGAANKERN